MADGTSSLASLNWGTSTGGAAGAAETTLTLGVNRTDVRTPPDTSHVWAAQIAAMENLLLAMSAAFKGMTRLQVLTQSSNPFSASESGFYIDSAGVAYSVFNGTRTALPFAQIVTATFTAVDNVAVSWSNLGGTQSVFQGVVNITDGGGGVVFHTTSLTSTGCTLNASAPFTGTVKLSIVTT